ncbi:hypothetical protein G7043_20145 [Lentzea sp. NEAU-D13]|uniref:Uncharacterized protein n=1 Tax=Lentzea alba TaxID=2714351 RepID=A0A7C9VX40_9PSEU|nr:hypothetical protein [Lentzea alba]NGY61241.1 hypothetical protein [Lentzea alba]
MSSTLPPGVFTSTQRHAKCTARRSPSSRFTVHVARCSAPSVALTMSARAFASSAFVVSRW